MVKQLTLQALFVHSQAAWSKPPDHRKPNPNTKYVLSDAVVHLVFFSCSRRSFLAHHQAMSGKRKGKQNLQTLFQVQNVPSDNQIRNLLEPLDPLEFAPQFEWVWQQVDELGGLDIYQTDLNTKLIALDGMVFHSSTTISCACCTTRRDRTGLVHYYHTTLLPVMVKPDLPHVFTCFPEMISPQDGHEKQS